MIQKDMAYYNEDQAAYILDKGKYYVRVGDSSRNTSVEATIEVDDTTLTEQLSNQMEVPDGEDLVEWSKPEEGYSYPTEEAEKKKQLRLSKLMLLKSREKTMHLHMKMKK